MAKRTAWAAIALVTTLVITGCASSADKGSSNPPASQPGQTQTPGAGGTTGSEKPAGQAVTAVAITAAEAPAALRDWAGTQGNAEQPAYKAVTEGGTTYLAVTGGLQPSGGYKVVVTDVTADGSGLKVGARVELPPQGSVVTTALTNPVGYFKLSAKVEGPVTVAVTTPPKPQPQGPGPAAGAELTVGSRWAEPGRLELTGTSPYPDLSFVLKAGTTKLGQADVQVKNGRFIGNILATPPKSTPELTLSVQTPNGKELRSIPVDVATPSDEVASPNFRVKSAVRTAPDSVTVQGRARAFEAVFLVEIRAGGKVLAHVPVKADAGAPAYGAFKAEIKVPGGVPEGAEAWFLTESAKDGSTTPELSVLVTNK